MGHTVSHTKFSTNSKTWRVNQLAPSAPRPGLLDVNLVHAGVGQMWVPAFRNRNSLKI
jgi:hypothetical protein